MKKMAKLIKKIIVIIMIIILLNNFSIISISNAQDDIDDSIGETGQGFFLSFLGLLTLPVRAIALGIGYAINSLTAAIAYIEGATDVNVDTTTITPFDIFFNKVKILDVNFFEIGSTVNIVNTIRSGIAAWYYALRLIAMSILLVILIYVGIRMAISTIASEKAMYKRMLVDWIVSLALIFLINYIIVFVITLNNIVIESLGKNVDAEAIADTYGTIRNLGFNWIDIDSIPATIIYCMLVAQTLGLVITYFNRMLKVAFLIIISPLITLTYAVDKMGDGKAQALGNWIREFIFTVITQIFHCIIYMSMINVAFNLLVNHAEKGIKHALTTAVMAILCVNFVRTAENLVRKILMHNHQDNSVSFSGGMAATAVALQKSKSIGSASRKAINMTKQNVRAAGNILKSMPKAAGNVITAPVKGVQALSEAIKTEKEWKKMEKAAGYDKLKSTDKQKYKATKYTAKNDIKARAQNAKSLSKAKQRAQAANKKREERKNARLDKKNNSKINNFRGKISRIASQSDALQFVGKIAKGYTAAGVGLLTGSMMYGVTGKGGQSFAIGIAGANATQAFFRTASTIESNTTSSLIAAGAKNKEEAFALLNAVASNPDLFDGKSSASVKQAEALLKRIGDQLEKQIGNPEYKKRIKNTIEQTAKANPERMPTAIQNVLSAIASESSAEEAKKLYPNDGEKQKKYMEDFQAKVLGNQELRNACDDYATFANMKQIHSQMEAAQEMGVSMDAFVQDCTEKFVNLEGNSSNTVDTQETSEMLEILTNRTPEYLQEYTQDMTTEQKDELITQMDAEREKIQKEMENATEDMKAYYEEQLKAYDVAEAELLMSIESAKEKALEEKQIEVLKRVKEEAGKEIDQLLAQLNIRDIDSKGAYKKVALRAAGISNNDRNVPIDDIITQRENQLKAQRNGAKGKVSEEKLLQSIENAKTLKKIQSIEQRRTRITETISRTNKKPKN